MRIRLLIERNELPSVSILWSFTSTQLPSTIAQFLENVNVRFPLEGNTWGLEDYTVSLAGYEAQHYTKVGEVFKEDDEVVIKPLLFAEARARTISGRYQITPDGRRLVDGVPFGKPLLKRMRRPEVQIPPARKRARIEAAEAEAEEEEEEMQEEQDEPGMALARFQEITDFDREDQNHEDDEDDGDFEQSQGGDCEDELELEVSEDDESTEIEEPDWESADERRVPIRAIYSKHRCLRKKYLMLIWDDDKQHYNLSSGEDPVRLPGSDKVFTISKTDVTLGLSINRDDHRFILKASSNQFMLIEFMHDAALSECYERLMQATGNAMISVSITAEKMQSIFANQKKLLLDAYSRLKNDEDEDLDDSDSSRSSSDSGSDSDSDSAREGVAQAPAESSDDSSDSSDTDSSSGSSSSDSNGEVGGVNEGLEDSDSDSDSSSSRIITSSRVTSTTTAITPPAAPASQLVIPGKGAARTKERNNRRREAARLKHLKASGELPESTTLQQMQEWLRTGELPAPSDAASSTSQKQGKQVPKDQDAGALELEKKRQQLINDINGGGIDISPAIKLPAAAVVPSSMFPPQLKKSKRKGKASTPVTDDDRPEEIPIATEPVIVYPVLPTPDIATEAAPVASSTEGPKRVSAAQRLIYGSLGLRAPRSQADKDALQKKLANRSKKPVAEVPAAEQEVEDENPEAWREKVIISAVECVDEGVTLSEPPFPFQQKWDPQYWSQNVKKRNAGKGGDGGRNKKRKKNGGGEVVEVYDKYNRDGGGDALNYDDPVEDDDDEWDDGEDWQDGALLGADEEEEEDDGFPALPEDVSSFPSLLEADAKVGDFVVFTEMACSDATGWQPKVVTTVGCLDATDDGAWTVRFSSRGGAKEYDDEGNRVYKKFEMEGFDDDAEDDNRQIQWEEMMDVKLLLRPGVVEEQAGIVEATTTEAGGVEEQIQSQLEGEMGKEASSSDQ